MFSHFWPNRNFVLLLGASLTCHVFLGPAPVSAAETDRYSKSAGNITVYANDLGSADIVAMQAEELRERFDQLLGINTKKSRIPLVLVLKDESKKIYRDCVIQMFRSEAGFKIQVEWSSLPISHETFVRGCIRGLCLRQALESKKQGLRDLAKETKELFVPHWISDGIAMLVGSETIRKETFGRARLISGTEPDMSLLEIISELEGKGELSASQQALAAVFCQFIFKLPAMSENFRSNFHFQKETRLHPLLLKWSSLPEEKLNALWVRHWDQQSVQFTAEKMGYRYMLRWILDVEEDGEIHIKNAKNDSMGKVDWQSAANPWFRSWMAGRTAAEDPYFSEKEMVKLRQDIQVRRSISLDWITQLENQNYSSRREVLLWDKIRKSSVLPSSGESSGEISKWFNSLPR